MATFTFTQSSYDPDAILDEGMHRATISEFRNVYDFDENNSLVEVKWKINGFTITEKLKINHADDRKKGFFQWKLRNIVAALGLPAVPEKKPGEDIQCDFDAVGKSCMVAVEHFVMNNGNKIATIKNYIAETPEKQYQGIGIQAPQKPAPTQPLVDDAIPF
jgi:hypothetical protein